MSRGVQERQWTVARALLWCFIVGVIALFGLMHLWNAIRPSID